MILNKIIIATLISMSAFAGTVAQGVVPPQREFLPEGIPSSVGMDRDALMELERFLSENPASVNRERIEMAVADWYYNHGQYDEALRHYRQVDMSTLNGSDADDCRYRKAYCLLAAGAFDEAGRLYDRLSVTPRYGMEARFYKGYIAYCRKDYDKALETFRSVKSVDAPVSMADYYVCQIYFLNGNYERALSMARKLIASPVPAGGPGMIHDMTQSDYTAEVNRIAGESMYNLGNDKAIPYLKTYVATAANPLASTRYILGMSEYRSGNYDDVIADLTPVAAENSAMGQSACLLIGQAYAKTGNYNGAMMAFEKACRMDFDRDVQEAALYNYAVAKMKGGQTPFGSSVATFEDFLQRFPDSRYAPQIEEYIITGYMTDNNYSEALRSIRAVKSPSEAVMRAKQQVLYTLGTRELAAGNINEALGYLTEARTMSRYNPVIAAECDLWIGDCHYRQGKYADAAKAYSDYIRASGPSVSNRPVALYNLGYARFGEKRFADALKEFERFVKSPGNAGTTAVADAYNRMADCYYYTSRFDRAASVYDKAYALDPAVGDYALYQKAIMKGLTRDHNAKVAGLEDMMGRFPSSGLIPPALLEMAESYTELGKTDMAIRTYKKLSSEYPGTTQGRQGYLLLAATYLYNGDRTAAIDAYKKLMKSYPTSEEAQMASDDLKRIYADDGNLQAYVDFVASIPNAPRIEASEIDELTYESARRSFLANGATVKLIEYLERFPKGSYVPQALIMLADNSVETGDDDAALRYASRLVADYPDSEQAVDALVIKADIEFSKGMGERALSSYRELESRSPSTILLNRARLGIMRVSRDLGLNGDVIAAADKLLSSSALGADQRYEAVFARAFALASSGRDAEAVQAWESIAADTDNLFGAKSAYYLAQHYFDSGNAGKARTTVDALIDSNTPHNYWLARGFILLSDIYRSEGRTFEADEYLKSLRENYPGKEADIFEMIDQRLK